MELQDDVLQSQRHLLRDEDTVDRAVTMLAVMGSLTAAERRAERRARLLYKHWGASTSATFVVAGVL
ncbi:hypothetical protein V8E54_005013 [Elaphomyces granulatus]